MTTPTPPSTDAPTPAPFKEQGPTLYIIDGHAQIFRAYHAIRSLSSPVTGEPTNATFGFVGMLLRIFKECRPEYLIVAIDVGGDKETFRSELYPPYKTNRQAPPEDLHPQVDRIVELCKVWGIPVIGVPGFEADDVIATLCTRCAAQDDLSIRIISRDKDLEQLIGPRVRMFDIHTQLMVDEATLMTEKGLKPSQIGDMLTLMGDNVDNVPGAHGIGPKTAAKLIAQYQSLDNLLAHLDELKGKQKESIEKAGELFPITRQLIALRHDVPFELDLQQARTDKPVPVDELLAMFKQLGFSRHVHDLQSLSGGGAAAAGAAAKSAGDQPSIAARSSSPTRGRAADSPAAPSKRSKKPASNDGPGLFGAMDEASDSDSLDESAAGDESSETPDAPESPRPAIGPNGMMIETIDPSLYRIIRTPDELADIIAEIRSAIAAGGLLSFDTETTSIHPTQADLCGISLSWQVRQGVYIPIRSPEPTMHMDEATVIRELRPLLEDAQIPKVGQNLKYDLIVLRRAGVRVSGLAFDTMIASYLIDPLRSSHGMDNLALGLLNYETVPISRLIGSGKKQTTFDQAPLEAAGAYAAEDADITLRLQRHLSPDLDRMELRELFDGLEMPLVQVLAELEFNGIRLDPAELDRQHDYLRQRIGELREQILATAGEPFNPDSPRQLAEVLFTKLGCKVVKRMKTGPSTDSQVLQKIADEQPGRGALVAELILEYRQMTKLEGTYMQALKQAIHPRTGRIHASFNQTVAATGRLSSSDPNLQNIPIRTEIGRQIRKAFIAEPGHLLLSADYSQIELRLLAHLSNDPALLSAFERDLDIHTAVASEVFDVPLQQVTAQQRSTAKMVNFGIVYGITAYGLARRLPADAAGRDVEVAKRIIADYNARYPLIQHFLQDCVSHAEIHGYVQTLCKRRRPIPEVRSANGNIQALGRRMAINTVVQGSAADLIKLAMVRLHERIEAERRPLKMLLQIHDELVFETPADQVMEQAAFVRHIMTNAMKLTVPLKVEVAWGENWMQNK